MKIDADKLNEARWAACNVDHGEGPVPTMEKATEAADRAVAAYLGIEHEDFVDALGMTQRQLRDHCNAAANEFKGDNLEFDDGPVEKRIREAAGCAHPRGYVLIEAASLEDTASRLVEFAETLPTDRPES